MRPHVDENGRIRAEFDKGKFISVRLLLALPPKTFEMCRVMEAEDVENMSLSRQRASSRGACSLTRRGT
jgi:hypothetical protein